MQCLQCTTSAAVRMIIIALFKWHSCFIHSFANCFFRDTSLLPNLDMMHIFLFIRIAHIDRLNLTFMIHLTKFRINWPWKRFRVLINLMYALWFVSAFWLNLSCEIFSNYTCLLNFICIHQMNLSSTVSTYRLPAVTFFWLTLVS